MAAVSPEDANVDNSLAQYLSGRDVPCPGCGYNLRGLKLDICPECGVKFSLGLHGHMPGFRGWLGAIIMTCIGMGFSLLLMAGGVIELVIGSYFDWIEFVLLGSFALLMIAGGVLVTWLIRRRRHFWQYSERELAWHMVGGGLMLILPIGLLILLLYLV